MKQLERGVCPHCYSDDLDDRATRCPHCAGSFGNSQFRQIAVALVIIALVIGAAVAVTRGMNEAKRKASSQVTCTNEGRTDCGN